MTPAGADAKALADRLTKKSKSLEPFGVFGCYVPAVLGWWAVPPY
jgi:hypothetical protein